MLLRRSSYKQYLHQTLAASVDKTTSGSGGSQPPAATNSSSSADGLSGVQYRVINPKALTLGQLYGAYDQFSQEFQDGEYIACKDCELMFIVNKMYCSL